MKLLYDENLSARLVERLAVQFPRSAHVDALGLHARPDLEIWTFARQHGYVLITKDSDFLEFSLLHGAPPKVVWLRVGNAGTERVASLLAASEARIANFVADSEEALLELDLATE